MERERYLRLVREAHELAFEREDFAAAATRYAEALGDLAPGELAYSEHHGEYSAVLQRLGRRDDALAQSRLALQASIQESGQDPDPGGVAIQRYFLGEQLLAMGRPDEALDAVAPSLATARNSAALLMMVQAEALAALGRLTEARVAAAEATKRASDKQRGKIAERLSRTLHAR